MPERKEAPEGIVLFSFLGYSGPPNLDPNVISKSQQQNLLELQARINRGEVAQTNNFYVDLTDIYGEIYPNQGLVLSKSIIETLDLISEGEVGGPVSGQYIYSGNYGETGWRSAVFSGYSTPHGNDSIGNPWSNSKWLRSVYYNEVPILSDKAQLNFQNVDTSFTVGHPNGDNLQTLTTQETSSRSIGEILRGGGENTKVYRILNKNAKGAIINIKLGSLSKQNNEDGSIGRDKILWQTSYRPLFSNITKQSDFSPPITETIFGKITSAQGYIHSTNIQFNTKSFFSKQTIVNTAAQNTTQTVISKKNIGNFLDNIDFMGWEIKITRITPDAISSLQTNSTFVDSITELYGSKFSYPNCSIVRSRFNAEFFSSIPDRAFEFNMRKVKIPGNYNPLTRTYLTNGFATTNGYWDGTFATGYHYTNNPAWCFYDMTTNNRFGLGKYIDNIDIDKFTLYKIGQYCDELVYDENGGLEPRFTCNTWMAGKNDAFNVINDLASVFRGMTYYAYGNLYSICDQPKTPRVTFTNANVENGDFSYSSTSKKSRHSIAIVSYNNPYNFYKPEIEYIEDIDSIRKYGIREVNLTAFACSSRAQAIRLGRWTLLTNNLENETVNFTAGLEAATLQPGEIFKVQDQNRKLKRYGGRVWNINNSGYGDVITLDSNVLIESGIEYKLSIVTPSYTYNDTQVTGLNAGDSNDIRRSFLQDFIFSGQSGYNVNNKTIINLNQSLNRVDFNISGYPIWSLELAPNSVNYSGNRYFMDSSVDYYRALNIKESETNKYEIVGLTYYEPKFNQIDSGINFQRPNISNINKTPQSPSNLTLDLYKQNSKDIIYYTFLIDNYSYINNFRIYATTGVFDNNVPSNEFLVDTLPADVIQSKYLPPDSGNYNIRIYSYNEVDNIYSSSYAQNNIEINKDNLITNIIISSLQIAP